MNERSGIDVILPSSGGLLLGSMVVVAVLGVAALIAVDLRRRDVAAWWVVGMLGVLIPPIGWTGWAVLRYEAWKAQRERVSTSP